MGLLFLWIVIASWSSTENFFHAMFNLKPYAYGIFAACLLGAVVSEFALFPWLIARGVTDRPEMSRKKVAVRWFGLHALVALACTCVFVLLFATPGFDSLHGLDGWILCSIALLLIVSGVLSSLWLRARPVARATVGSDLRTVGRFATLELVVAAVAWGIAAASLAGLNAPGDARREAESKSRAYYSSFPCPDTAGVVVRTIRDELPSEPEALERSLWDRFANRPEEQRFSNCTNDDWEATYARYSLALVNRARALDLESEGLSACLDSIASGLGAFRSLPVGAYQMKQNRAAVWIVVLKRQDAPGDRPMLGSSTRIVAFDATTARKLM